jgi:hypothetical protein
MTHHRSGRFARLFGIAALAALILSSSAITRAGAGLTQLSPPDLPGSTATSASDDAEHDEGKSPEIRINWLLPSTPVRLFVPAIRLELAGMGLTAPMELEVRSIVDGGTLQSRRVTPAVHDTLVAPYRIEIPLRFDAGVATQTTHSGMIVAVVKACASDGRCLIGTSPPRFFHADSGGFLVYDEKGLCQFFGCGALGSPGTPERGTWRVMGGGPLHAVPSREEPGGEVEVPVVAGGER